MPQSKFWRRHRRISLPLPLGYVRGYVNISTDDSSVPTMFVAALLSSLRMTRLSTWTAVTRSKHVGPRTTPPAGERIVYYNSRECFVIDIPDAKYWLCGTSEWQILVSACGELMISTSTRNPHNRLVVCWGEWQITAVKLYCFQSVKATDSLLGVELETWMYRSAYIR